MPRLLPLAALALGLATPALAQMPTNAPRASTTDPRANLRAGWNDAQVASWNLEHVANIPRSGPFVNPENPGDFDKANTDLAFQGQTMFVGNYSGVQIYSLADPARPALVSQIVCAGGQGDVSVHGNLLFMSVEETRGRLDCGSQGVPEPVSAERLVGIRVFDISNLQAPRQVATVQTCRGSHTHTLVPDPSDPQSLYVYVSGISGVRSGEELTGCAGGSPAENAEGSSYFRIEVVKVPLAAPQNARVVNSARFLLGLPAAPESASEIPSDAEKAEASARAAEARARGKFTITWQGLEQVLPDAMAAQILQQMMGAAGRTGEPTAADSTMLRERLPQLVAQQEARNANRTGPTSCHDITVYPEKGLAGGACEGYGILLDISDPQNPRRLDSAGDANFAYWHSATFNNDATSVVFTDEWGGGGGPRCRVTDRMEWGANALFRIHDGKLHQTSYYKLPAAQGSTENCVAHNGSLVPIPGRDVMVQAWYQGGLSIFDFTNPAAPREIAYFDRGPMSADDLVTGGYWSVYWYNGYIYGSEIGRGVDVFRLTPSSELTADEVAAANTVRATEINPQLQTKIVWPASVVLSRTYLKQARDAQAVTTAQNRTITATLLTAERARTATQKRAVATRLNTAARSLSSSNASSMRLAESLRALAATLR
ncbi:MAG: hypothetical protein LCH53_01150 [Bacteroidetes bacterium]|nr:hypothetical protein [Bacteroidota bacterium]